jgi:hypothetical protein
VLDINSVWREVITARAELTPKEFAAASRFKARWEFASQLTMFSANSLQDRTLRGYFALTKLGLAYSAVEALQQTTGKGWNLFLRHDELAARIAGGELEKLIKHIQNAAQAVAKKEKRTYKPEIEVYLTGEKQSDLLPLVKHSRHVMFHGAITPTSVALANRQRQDLVLRLAEATLNMTAAELRRWLVSRTKANG